jgi:hypothetical protein
MVKEYIAKLDGLVLDTKNYFYWVGINPDDNCAYVGRSAMNRKGGLLKLKNKPQE